MLVASERELRRELFDVLDAQGHPPIHSARDTTHAAILLEGREPLALIVVAFDGDGRSSLTLCEQLRLLPPCTDAPILAVLIDDATIKPTQLPAVVSGWLYASQVGAELISRWHQLQGDKPEAAEEKPASKAVIASPARPSGGDYRFVFEDGDGDWLIIDPLAQRVVEASPAYMRHSGLANSVLTNLGLSEVLSFESVSMDKAFADADRRWLAAQRKSIRGHDTGEASARRVQQNGRELIALQFRSDLAGVRPAVALTLLARLFSGSHDDAGIKDTAQLLLDDMGMDYLAVWSARPEESSVPVQVVQRWRGDEQVWPGPQLQSSLRLVLGGRTLMHPHDARRLADVDPLIGQLGLRGFVGLPLLDERRNVLGALLAGSRNPFAEPEILEPVLHCSAAHFAHMLELRRTREQGRAEGLLDALTGLPNRLLFNDRLDTIIREANRTGETFAVLFVDLDRFKFINDTLGHAVGDQVLVAVTQRLRSSVRASDTVARYAGDEFTIVLRHIVKTDDVMRVADKIVQLMDAPLHLEDGPEIQVTASIGISFFPEDAPDAETLLKHADEAMYAAKSMGRNNYRVYDVSPAQEQQNAALKARLRHAEANGELRVFYQPQINATSEDIVGMEALLRWEHPELGNIGPGFFIPLAEETGLIVSIGEWVLRTACKQAKIWEDRFGLRLRLGVNLSAVQLMQPDLSEVVADVLQETGLEPGLLELEVTESISIKAAPNLMENMQKLHRLGCHIAIDDFGTGAASLDYLRKLPADRIKIDQSFVRNIGVDPDDEAIVRATIEMAHRLKRGVVAEGVEIEQHLQFLRTNNCDELQGYLFCRPLPQSSFERLLSERERLLSGIEDRVLA
ncbi:putative bifunctional diguanylate cyclase/phosphodiesterase [Dyella sp.]|uniref:putative bifunctional diguanylate cyclase/phosphodiesterase n=1 Tax=Dyella sp. TaxID=1869338 RepID=UPI002D09F81D|nr:EAL domain-containing protein [Dyella sp.]HTC26311.1 EAL domain-containing protein [Dyella sp.]